VAAMVMSNEPYKVELARIAATVANLASLTDVEIEAEVARTWMISIRIDEADFRDLWIRSRAIAILALRKRSTFSVLGSAIEYFNSLLCAGC
jgi:hypothetical protein